jgi:hypothetical protein
MKSAIASATIGLTIGIGPAIVAHLMLRIGLVVQLGPVILGFIVGMQAASRRRARYGICRPDGATENTERPQAEHFISRAKSGNGMSP